MSKKKFTCPDCGGHHLRVIVEFHADVTSFGRVGQWFRLDDEQPGNAIARFYCYDCDWETKEDGSVMENVK